MGSMIEINDTLQITAEQGWPKELDIEKHLENPITLGEVKDTIYEFHDKPAIRVYKQPPVRNFLAQNIGGKWIYWGQIFMLEITHDYENKTTSGKFRIIKLNTPEEMKEAFRHLDIRPELDYFGQK
jgi:hypothetical protein